MNYLPPCPTFPLCTVSTVLFFLPTVRYSQIADSFRIGLQSVYSFCILYWPGLLMMESSQAHRQTGWIIPTVYISCGNQVLHEHLLGDRYDTKRWGFSGRGDIWPVFLGYYRSMRGRLDEHERSHFGPEPTDDAISLSSSARVFFYSLVAPFCRNQKTYHICT